MPASSFSNFSIDTLVNQGPTLLYGLDILASAVGGDVTLYEGLDSLSGRKIGAYKGTTNITIPIRFTPELFLARGLYADVGSSISEVTIYYSPHRTK